MKNLLAKRAFFRHYEIQFAAGTTSSFPGLAAQGMGGRAVEGTGLENRQGGNSFVGSNPTPSAKVS